MTNSLWPNRLQRPRWLRDQIAIVVTGLIVGNLLLVVVLVLVMR